MATWEERRVGKGQIGEMPTPRGEMADKYLTARTIADGKQQGELITSRSIRSTEILPKKHIATYTGTPI